MQAFEEKLAAFFQPVRQVTRFEGRGDRRNGPRRGYGQSPTITPHRVVSDTLRNSRLLKPARTEASPREAVSLLSLVNHPALAESRLEQLAGLDFGSPAARKLFSALLDLSMAVHDISGAALREKLGGRGFGPDIERMEGLLR